MTPGVKELCPLQSVGSVSEWVRAIPRASWGRVLMRSGAWNNFDEEARPIVDEVMDRFPGRRSSGLTISYIPPEDLSIGSAVHPHKDGLPSDDWLIRIHVPLQTNPQSIFYCDDVPYHMEVGKAYEVDITKLHYNRNPGPGPRVHLWFDILKGSG